MTVDKIQNEKPQHNISMEAAKRSASSSDKIDKYKYLIGKETLPSNQSQMIKQAKFPT